MLLCLEQGNRTNSKEINTARGKDGEMVRQRGKDYGKRLWGRETKNKGKRGRGAERESERERKRDGEREREGERERGREREGEKEGESERGRKRERFCTTFHLRDTPRVFTRECVCVCLCVCACVCVSVCV